jgi:hypothetical protein
MGQPRLSEVGIVPGKQECLIWKPRSASGMLQTDPRINRVTTKKRLLFQKILEIHSRPEIQRI